MISTRLYPIAYITDEVISMFIKTDNVIKNQHTKSTTTKLSVALTITNSMIKEICLVLLNMKF